MTVMEAAEATLSHKGEVLPMNPGSTQTEWKIEARYLHVFALRPTITILFAILVEKLIRSVT